MDAVIRILRGVRQRGHDVHLHILGGLSDSGFGAELRAMAEVHRGWVFLEGRLGGAKKKQMLVRHRFGIHGRTNEPFGIAVAEMVEAGCTVFVPDGGGQTEIVDHPRLTYSDDEMAVEKIDAVLRSADMQATLRKHLKSGARRFSVDKFQKGLLELVREYIGGQPYEQPMPASHRQSSVGKER